MCWVNGEQQNYEMRNVTEIPQNTTTRKAKVGAMCSTMRCRFTVEQNYIPLGILTVCSRLKWRNKSCIH